ncbi:MAG TPA: polysaccharide biosynthesis tyrosine autokinase [Blastocatellia bacterium]|nr:polysaccharide biosynthesis tyrosine autokinase [Blastocatellia bacterium]
MADERFELEKYDGGDASQNAVTALPIKDVATVGYRTPLPINYSYGYGYGQEDEKIHLREVWRILRKRKWLVISIVVIVTTLVGIEMFRRKAVYQASTTIEIGKENSTVVRSGDLVINDESDPQYQVNIKTKMILLGSRELHEDVVANLKLDQNPKFLRSGEESGIGKVFGSIFGKGESQPPIVQDESLVDETDADAPARSAEESARLAPYVEALEENLVIEPLRDTRAIKVSFTHNDPAIAAAVANGVARAFIQRSFQAKTEKFTNTASWLSDTTRDLKSKVERAEQALADYTRDHNIFSVTDENNQQTTLTTEKLQRLHDQALRAETDRMLKQTLYEEVKAGRIAQLPEAFGDQNLKELQKQLNDLQTQAAQLSVKFSAKNPRIIEIQQQIATVQSQINDGRKSLEQKLQNDYERAVQDEKSLKGALEQTKGEAARENQDAIQYNILKQDVETARSLYNDFLQKTNQAKAQVAEQHNNIRLLERAAVPKKPIGPKRAMMIVLALMVSLAGSIGLVFFLEYLDNTIKNVEDVSRYVQLPALGVIPAISAGARRRALKRKSRHKALVAADINKTGEAKPNQLMALETRSTVAEAYRALRTSVLLSSAGNPPRTILVTSSQPDEGKTTTAVNTAISLAQLGASVLIIDCDLRKPMVHKVFNVDQTVGLSTYLSRDVEIDKLIQPLSIKNVSLLPCGPIPPNPAELISSDKMKNMLAQLAERYDHILIDSPPLMNVTDPVILSKMVDGVMLVVHGGKSSRQVVRRARQELASVGAKIFGVVLNNVDLRNEGYDDYYYARYYYGYERTISETTA